MANEPYGYIYLIINKINSKVYVGQTTRSFKDRYRNDIRKYTHNEYLKRSIDKYGINNFMTISKFDKAFSESELNMLEEIWINYFGGANSSSVYNMRDGGGKRIASDDLREKMSKSQQKRYSKMTSNEKSNIFGKSMRGKKMSSEQKHKISNSMKGRSVSNVTKIKISNSLKGNKRSLESIEKQKLSIGKKVICVNSNIVYDSMKKAEIETGALSTEISKCCRGKAKSAGKDIYGNKLIWKYYEEGEDVWD